MRDLGDRLMAPKRAALLNTFPICEPLHESMIYRFNVDLSGVPAVVVTWKAV